MLIDLRTVYESKKQIVGSAVWIPGAKRLSYSLPLTIAGVAVEGLWFEISTPIFAVERDVHIILVAETEGAKRGCPIERIDWRPNHDHNNRNRGPSHLRHKVLTCSHVHSFDCNWVAAENCMIDGNLPIAEVVDIDNLDAQSLFQFALDRFRIESTGSDIPLPPWQSDLFG